MTLKCGLGVVRADFSEQKSCTLIYTFRKWPRSGSLGIKLKKSISSSKSRKVFIADYEKKVSASRSDEWTSVNATASHY